MMDIHWDKFTSHLFQHKLKMLFAKTPQSFVPHPALFYRCFGKLQLPSKQKRTGEAMQLTDLAASYDERTQTNMVTMEQNTKISFVFPFSYVWWSQACCCFQEMHLITQHLKTTWQFPVHAMQVLCPRSILLNQGAYLILELLMQSVEKDIMKGCAQPCWTPDFPDYGMELETTRLVTWPPWFGCWRQADESLAILKQDWIWRASLASSNRTPTSI